MRKKNSSQQKRLNDKDIFGTNNGKVLKTQRYDKINSNSSSKYSPVKGMYQSKSTSNIQKGGKTGPSPNKNFKVINQKKEAYDTANAKNSNLQVDKFTTKNYNTGVKDDKGKGHYRGETWTNAQYLGRKTSNTGSKSRQSLQNSTSSNFNKGYKAYLTNKRVITHSRKKNSIGQLNPELTSAKVLSGSQSVSKLGKGILKTKSGFDSVRKEQRQSLNKLDSGGKYLNKPQNRKFYEKNNYISKSEIAKKLSTPTNISKDPQSFKTSGILTARTVEKDKVDIPIQKSEKKESRKGYGCNMTSSETRRTKLFTKKLRTKSRGEVIVNKETSSNSSKTSNKCLSSISKSNSRRKDKVGSSKHMKKKSAAIPTRSTKALYSNKSDYDKKRNEKAIVGLMKPSSSAANIETRYSARILANKRDISHNSKLVLKSQGLKYPSGENSK